MMEDEKICGPLSGEADYSTAPAGKGGPGVMPLREGERLDDTGFGTVRVIQRPGQGYGVDSVLLAAFAAGETGAAGIRAGSRAADLGTGSGIVALTAAHKIASLTVDGFEVNAETAERAARAAVISGLNDRVRIICSDVLSIDGRHDYDAVMSNPPYFRRRNDEEQARRDERYLSRHETTAGIDDFARAASSMLKSGGSFYLVHRPDRLADIFMAMRNSGIEPKEMQFVVPEAGHPANIVLIRGVKDAGPELRMLPEIAVRNADGNYTGEILRFYER